MQENSLSSDNKKRNAQARRFQNAFFRRAGKNAALLRTLAETLPGVRFNIVDDQDRIVALNRENCANCNFTCEAEAVGRKIADLFPSVLANAYVSLYREARESKRPILNRLTTHGADRSTTPRRASVFPLYDADGQHVVGTACFYTTQPSNESLDWYASVQKAVSFINEHFTEKLTLEQLADASQLSLASFRRAFRKILEITPGDYIATIRVNHARNLLVHTDLTVEEIARASGFYDQSHFVKTFRKLRHETPTAFRKKSPVPNALAPGKA